MNWTAPNRKRTAQAFLTLATLAAAPLLGGCGTSAAGSAHAAATVTVTATVTATPSSDPTPVAPAPPAKPKARDFKIRLRIRSKECFGSAGCNITYQINPRYVGDVDLSHGSYDVTYKVLGGEDGPQINTFTIHNGRASFDREEIISTPSSDTVLTAKVTHVYRH